MREMFNTLVDAGLVQVSSRNSPKTVLYQIISDSSADEAPQPCAQKASGASVATFPVPRVLAGTLSGYTASLMSGRNLALQTPGRNR